MRRFSQAPVVKLVVALGGLVLVPLAARLPHETFLAFVTAACVLALAVLALAYLGSPGEILPGGPEAAAPPAAKPRAGRPKSERTVIVLGPTGCGKSSLVLALHRTLTAPDPLRVARLVSFVSPPVYKQIERVRGHEWPERTEESLFAAPASGGERPPLGEIVYDLPGARVRLIDPPGEDLVPGRTVDLPRVLAAVNAERVDLLLLVVNPFVSPRNAGPSLLGLTAYWQRRGVPFPAALDLASSRLFGKDLHALRKQKTGLELIPNEVLAAVRLTRARPGLPSWFGYGLEGAEPDQTAAVGEVLRRTAETLADEPSAGVVRDLIALRPDSVAVGTRADLLAYFDDVNAVDLQRTVDDLFPHGQAVRRTQSLLVGSYQLELDSNLQQPVYLAGVNPDCGTMLTAIEAELFGPAAAAEWSPAPAPRREADAPRARAWGRATVSANGQGVAR